jgi:hypothetical protein
MFPFNKPKPKPKNQAEAFELFKESIQAAINQARQAGVWPITLGNYLEAHAVSMGAAQGPRR